MNLHAPNHHIHPSFYETSATSDVDDRFKTCEFGFYNLKKIKFEDKIFFLLGSGSGSIFQLIENEQYFDLLYS